MASLRKHPNTKFFYCCFTLPDGTRTQRSTKRVNRQEALAVCIEWERTAVRARSGELTEVQARKVVSDICERAGIGAVDFISVEKFLMNWITSKEETKAKGTTKRYRYVLESFLASLGDRRVKTLSSISAQDIIRIRDLQIAQGKSPSTANMAVKTLRIALNAAKRQGLIPHNPAEAVDALPAERGQRKTFNRDQIRALMKVADVEWQGLILLGACHGVRLGDAAKMNWGNIDMERRSLVFYPQKTSRTEKRKPEEYPLHEDVEAYLNELTIQSNDSKAPLFPKLSKKRLNGRTGLSGQFRELMHRAQIFTEGESEERKSGSGRRFFELGFHSLRHTCISEMANNGVSKEIRMKLSGHKSAVHERYTHHDLESLRAQVDTVPSFLKPTLSPE